MTRLLWTQKQYIGHLPRRSPKLVYDIKRSRSVLYGGLNPDNPAFPFNDTWEWDGESWTQVADLGPSKREFHALAYDSARNCAVLFGGFDYKRDLMMPIFPVQLQKAYYKGGFFNITVDYDHYVR